MANKVDEIVVKMYGRMLSSALFERGKPYMGKGQGNFYIHVGTEKDSEAYNAVWAAIKKIAAQAWGSEAKERLQELINDKGFVFRNGNRRKREDGSPNEYYKNLYYLVGSSQVKPTLVDGRRNEIDKDSGLLRNGDYVVAHIAIYYSPKHDGIFGQLQGVQHAKTGVRFGGGGRVSSKDEFEELKDPDEEGDDLVGAGAGGGIDDDDLPF